MAAIDVYLQQILDAVYGEEVRGSIHDSIAAMNVESTTAEAAAISAQNSATESASIAVTAKNNAVTAKDDAVTAKNAAEAAARQAESAISGAIRYRDARTFAQIPTSGQIKGDMYNITDQFTADSRFRAEDQGKTFRPGANIVWDNNNKWDVVGYSSGYGAPAGGKTGQFLTKNSNSDGDLVWGGGNYSFATIAAMNTAIGNGTVPNGGICYVDEGSGGTPAVYLNQIVDVNILNPATNHTLMYDAQTNTWKNADALPQSLTTAQKNALKALVA